MSSAAEIKAASRFLNLFESTADALRAMSEALDSDEFDAAEEAAILEGVAEKLEELDDDETTTGTYGGEGG